MDNFQFTLKVFRYHYRQKYNFAKALQCSPDLLYNKVLPPGFTIMKNSSVALDASLAW